MRSIAKRAWSASSNTYGQNTTEHTSKNTTENASMYGIVNNFKEIGSGDILVSYEKKYSSLMDS